MSAFKVGEVAIGCNYVTLPDRNGMECEIVGGLQLISAFECRLGHETTKPRYTVRWSDGLESVTQPHALRKKHRRAASRQVARQVMLDCIDRIKLAAKRGAYA